MKKLVLLSFVFLFLFSGIIYSQTESRSAFSNQSPVTVIQPSLIKGSEGLIGAQCIGGIVYDDNTFENGYGFNTGMGVGKYVMKLTPVTYPYTFNQVCLALTRTSAGSASWTFDIVFYDETGPAGGPGNLIANFPNKIAANVPIWPAVTWFDFTALSSVPQLSYGSYYVGISYDPNTMPNHYIGVDESGTTPVRVGYNYISGSWSQFSGSFKALGVRGDGTVNSSAHNIAVGPFVNFPTTFIADQQRVIKARVANLGTSNEPAVPMKFVINGVQLSTTSLNLNAGEVDTVSFNWIPADPGNFTIKIISALSSDTYKNDDTVKATIYVYPSGLPATCIGSGVIPVQYPFYTYYMDSKTDMLYLANEIGTGGAPCSILLMGYNILSAVPQVMNGFKIRMQNTTLTSINSFSTNAWTEVFSGNFIVSGTGWQYISLQTPFQYSGANLLVEVCFNNTSYTTSSTVASTTTSTTRVFHNHQDLTTTDGCIALTTGSVQATLPNMCIITNFVGNQNNHNKIPSVFSLEQNYPNPFNPVTSINYSIPIQSHVKLIVYDILGKEIAILVNEKLSAGTYEALWDASAYSSGVYYYRIECDNFTDVKKMVLVK
ncbi:MAG: T9SS C-terminal target domain-containing protein [Ignavibacteriae bacterium]|nr:MAG: T9SS C-terminal target domain-containing protein [Ignavibacteriota bacterium]